jgi:hypothetical protein
MNFVTLGELAVMCTSVLYTVAKDRQLERKVGVASSANDVRICGVAQASEKRVCVRSLAIDWRGGMRMAGRTATAPTDVEEVWVSLWRHCSRPHVRCRAAARFVLFSCPPACPVCPLLDNLLQHFAILSSILNRRRTLSFALRP